MATTDLTNIEFREMVKTLSKDGGQIVKELTDHKAHIWHMATGISGESGELLDAIKKAVAYNKAPDMENIIEELGDLEFYMEGLRQAFSISREETLQKNMNKLAKRYKGFKYSDKAAHDRADKK